MRASAWFPTNQYLESALWLTLQITPATSIFSPLRCAREHFSCRVPDSRFTRSFGVFPISLSLALLYTSVLVAVNTQYLLSQRLPLLSLGTQLVVDVKKLIVELTSFQIFMAWRGFEKTLLIHMSKLEPIHTRPAQKLRTWGEIWEDLLALGSPSQL